MGKLYLWFVDFCHASITVPKTLVNLVIKDRTLSFLGCVGQFFFLGTFVATESSLLAVMACDRFMAICNPLLYPVAVSQKLCGLLVVGAHAWGAACSSHVLLSGCHVRVSTQSATSSVSPPCAPSLALILPSASCCFSFLPP